MFKGQNTRFDVHSEAVFQVLEFLHCMLNPRISGSRKLIQIRWEKPLLGWVCLNTNGSALGNPGRVSCGGVIWNDRGDWIEGFSRSIEVTISFIVELWALRDNLNLCHNLHLHAVDIQIDVKDVVNVLSNSSYTNRFVMPKVVKIGILCRIVKGRWDCKS